MSFKKLDVLNEDGSSIVLSKLMSSMREITGYNVSFLYPYHKEFTTIGGRIRELIFSRDNFRSYLFKVVKTARFPKDRQFIYFILWYLLFLLDTNKEATLESLMLLETIKEEDYSFLNYIKDKRLKHNYLSDNYNSLRLQFNELCDISYTVFKIEKYLKEIKQITTLLEEVTKELIN